MHERSSLQALYHMLVMMTPSPRAPSEVQVQQNQKINGWSNSLIALTMLHPSKMTLLTEKYILFPPSPTQSWSSFKWSCASWSIATSPTPGDIRLDSPCAVCTILKLIFLQFNTETLPLDKFIVKLQTLSPSRRHWTLSLARQHWLLSPIQSC